MNRAQRLAATTLALVPSLVLVAGAAALGDLELGGCTDRVEWGASAEDVLDACPSAVPVQRRGVLHILQAEGVDAAGQRATVIFHLVDGRLVYSALRLSTKASDGEDATDLIQANALFDKLEILLDEQIGPSPRIPGPEGDIAARRDRFTPQTRVRHELKWAEDRTAHSLILVSAQDRMRLTSVRNRRARDLAMGQADLLRTALRQRPGAVGFAEPATAVPDLGPCPEIPPTDSPGGWSEDCLEALQALDPAMRYEPAVCQIRVSGQPEGGATGFAIEVRCDLDSDGEEAVIRASGDRPPWLETDPDVF